MKFIFTYFETDFAFRLGPGVIFAVGCEIARGQLSTPTAAELLQSQQPGTGPAAFFCIIK